MRITKDTRFSTCETLYLNSDTELFIKIILRSEHVPHGRQLGPDLCKTNATLVARENFHAPAFDLKKYTGSCV